MAAFGPQLVAFIREIFRENLSARYGMTYMCVGRG